MCGRVLPRSCICWSFMCIFSGWETCVPHYNAIRGNAVLGPRVQSGFLFIFFLKQGNLSFFPCVFCAHFLFNADTQFTFLAPRTLSAPHSEVCKGHFVFSDHISIHRPPPGSVPLPAFCLCKDYFLCCHGINVTVTA